MRDAETLSRSSTSFRMKRAGKINILPCNLAGSFEATLTYGWKSRK